MEHQFYEYAITAKKTRNPVLKEHYLDYLDYLTDKGTVADVYFETTRGLHCHFKLRCISKLDYNILKPTKYGWNVKAVPIYNKSGWLKYCRKDFIKNQELNNHIFLSDLSPEDSEGEQNEMSDRLKKYFSKNVFCCNNNNLEASPKVK